jgi:hypothetical protein
MVRVMGFMATVAVTGGFVFKYVAFMAILAQQPFVGVFDFVVRVFIVIELNARPPLVVVTLVAFDAVIAFVDIV